LRIPIAQIFPDPQTPVTSQESVRDLPRGSRTARDPVVLIDIDNDRYLLLAGAKKLRTAQEADEKEVECTVKESVTEQERWELVLAEQYHSSLVPPMDLGQSFIEYRDRYGITQQELARRTGITPGTIHHYESLIRTLAPDLGGKVNSGELTFKEARSIADIDDHERQLEIAKPFVDGRLSSVHVERIVGRAKNAPELSIDQIIEEVVNGKRPAHKPEPEKTEVTGPQPQRERNTESMENMVLHLAGELDALPMQVIPEYRRLKLISCLRILDSRLKSALVSLNSGRALESAIARPMTKNGAVARR
jgi:ParB-like chromosome segregation protein Spo0J